MHDHKISVNNYCPCTQPQCPVWGNCVLCIQAHLDHKEHLPECMENLLREKVKDLSAMMEFTVSDSRPTPEFWESFDKEGYLKECLDRHMKKG